MFSSIALLLATCLATPVLTSPPKPLAERADRCGSSDSVSLGGYTVYNNLWNAGGVSGRQCFGVDGVRGTSISWHTTWSWSGDSKGVKTYPNAVVQHKPARLSSLQSMKTKWSWSYTGTTNMKANVAYDLFTSSSPNGAHEYEFMFWIAEYGGVGPISAKYDARGKPVPIATITLAQVEWNVYKGSNGVNTVFSFLRANRQFLSDFDGDLVEFVRYLTEHQKVPASQYLVSTGAGTEATSGNDAKFTTKGYSLVVT